MSASNVKEKIINLFPKNYQPKDYKPKKKAGAFNDNYVKYKSEGDEQLTIEKNI